MRKFTDTELELAPKVAEVIGGVWDEPYKHEWPLEHDCLEFLRERGWANYRFSLGQSGSCEEMHVVQVPFEFRAEQEQVVRGDTLLEAWYRVIVSVGNQSDSDVACGEKGATDE